MKEIKIFNKLVRDKIPEMIWEKGSNPQIETLDNMLFLKALDEKFLEECNEVIKSKNIVDKIEETGDVMEVICAILKANKISFEEVESVRMRKREKHGGFENKIFLKSTEIVDF